jgi:tetrahydromethanopterin S-methyltransferase subunit D
VTVDPITGYEQEKYVSPGTEGHGVPTVCYVSGIIGGLLGGAGGGLIYYYLYDQLTSLQAFSLQAGETVSIAAAMTAGIFALAIFFVNSVVASYNIGGTIEGFHDPKFKRLPRGILACIVASLVIGIVGVLLLYGGAA